MSVSPRDDVCPAPEHPDAGTGRPSGLGGAGDASAGGDVPDGDGDSDAHEHADAGDGGTDDAAVAEGAVTREFRVRLSDDDLRFKRINWSADQAHIGWYGRWRFVATPRFGPFGTAMHRLVVE